LENQDFIDDKKDAGEIGAGHTVTALYEVILAKAELQDSKQDLKYQETKIKKSARQTAEVLTVKIRYKQPDEDISNEISAILQGDPKPLDMASENFRFSAAVAQFAQILRDSEYQGNADLASVLALAEAAKGKDIYGYRAEFINLVNRYMLIEKK